MRTHHESVVIRDNIGMRPAMFMFVVRTCSSNVEKNITILLWSFKHLNNEYIHVVGI